jgi:hypothetical protein
MGRLCLLDGLNLWLLGCASMSMGRGNISIDFTSTQIQVMQDFLADRMALCERLSALFQLKLKGVLHCRVNCNSAQFKLKHRHMNASRVCRESLENFWNFAWRPRPPSQLPPEKERELTKNLRTYAKRYCPPLVLLCTQWINRFCRFRFNDTFTVTPVSL